MLARRCSSCHNDDRTRGGLSLTSHEAIMEGGKDGPVVRPGDPARSDLFRRISLAHDEKKFMPASGRPALTPDQTAAIRIWIEVGAPGGGTLAGSRRLKPADLAVLQKTLPGAAYADADADNLPASEPLPVVPPADPATVAGLERTGFLVRPVARTSQMLTVDLTVQRPLTGEDFASLARIAPQIHSLSLKGGSVSDADLKGLAAMVNLSRLRLEQNPVTGRGLASVRPLKRLTYLNLVGTKVSDAGLASLAAIPTLKSLYLWDSGATAAGVERFVKRRPDVRVVSGLKPQDVVAEPKRAPIL
jgi:hypothetical protein